MNAYEVRITEVHGISLSSMKSCETYVGEIVRVETGDVAYRTKYYHEAKTARLQAARFRKNYEHHLAKHGVGFEQQEADRKAGERAARDAKREADRRVRDAAHDLLAALERLLPVAASAYGALTVDLDAARAAIAKATG